jgi:antitoxin component YwqK of YwqJK toxin-antitoxin module
MLSSISFKPIDCMPGEGNVLIRTPSPIRISPACSPNPDSLRDETIKHGIIQKFNHGIDNNKLLIEECSYTFGVLHGPYRRWHPNGVLCEDSIYDNNKLIVQKYYNVSGQISAEYNYVDGQKQGLQKMWHPNGAILFEGHYLNGICFGEHNHYNIKGIRILLENFNCSGQLHGTCQKWYHDGQLAEDFNFVDGKSHGMAFKYVNECIISFVFDNGTLIQMAECHMANITRKHVIETNSDNPRPAKRVRFNDACK